ncbi:MAG: hypothetical protein RMX35_20490 [Nostoc sp. DcaGUA01]|nr:hypothetical protein [Nostoc sp. DcaGUA01]
MQIIKPLLTNNTHPLGITSSLSNTHRFIFRKESDFLHSRSHLISPIQTKSPLVTSSHFLLSREQEPSIQPVIGWDSWDNPDINSGFPFIDFDPFESTDSEENNNLDTTELVKSEIRQIPPNVIGNNIIKEISPETNIKKPSKNKIQTKSQPKSTNKSQQQPKTKTKSTNKKSVKSSAAKNVVKAADESNIPINLNQDIFILSDDSLSTEVNSSIEQTKNESHVLKSQSPDSLYATDTLLKLGNPPTQVSSSVPLPENNSPTLEHDIDDELVSNSTPIITASISPNVQDQPTLFRKPLNEETKIISELPSSLSSTEASIPEKNSSLEQNNKLDNNTSELVDNSPKKLSLAHNNGEKISPPSEFNNEQQEVVTEESQKREISDISASPTVLKQDIETTKSSKKIDIPDISASPTVLKQDIETTQSSKKIDIPDISVSETPLQQDIETTQSLKKIDISDISVSTTPLQQVIETTQSLQKREIPDISVSETPLQQVIETDEFPSQVDNQNTVSSTNVIPKKEISPISKPSSSEQEPLNTNKNLEAIKGIEPDSISEKTTINFDTANFIADHYLENLPLSSAVTSPSVDDTPTLFHPLTNDENTVGTHSYVSIPPVFGDNSESSIAKSPIVVQQEIDSSFTTESLASEPVQLTPTSANIRDTSNFISDSDNNEKLVNSESQSSVAVNVSNVPTNVISLQRDRNFDNTISESIENQQILAADQIVEEPKLSNISSEIVEEAKLSNILPEIVEEPKVSNISSEIVEAQNINNISREIIEAPKVSKILPEIIEAPKVSNISPEIVEEPKVTDVSSNIGEKSSISRKIVDNEQIVESELLSAIANSNNSEILTFIDTSDRQNLPEKPNFSPNQVSTPPEVEQNTTIQNLAAPKGYATGGQVTDSQLKNNQHIAPSDTVPAMLTPGEFVINTRDAQKNLPLLQHINSGGTPDNIILPRLEVPNAKEPEKTTSPQSSTKVDSFPDTSLQLKPQESNSLIPSSLASNIGKQKLSVLNSPQLNTVQSKTTDALVTSPQYSSPPLIFRKANSTTNTPSQWSDTPSEWSSVQELFNGNNDEFTSFFSGGESNSQNSEFGDVYTSSESSQVFAKHHAATRGFAEGGEVTASTSGNTESVTETVQSPSGKNEEDNKDDTADLEALAREIYSRLRQRLEIERERHGGYLGRLS